MHKRVSTMLLLALVALVVCVPNACCGLPHCGKDEIKMGNDAVKEADKEHPILNDQKMLARVQAIGTPIAMVANNEVVSAHYGNSDIYSFPYTFKVVDSDEVNAFSLPGGHIYINRGVINMCQSDHELAAVIAHEIAHAAHHHMVGLVREQSKLEGKMAVLLVAGMLGKMPTRDMSNVIAGAQFYKVAKISGYGQMAEHDADMTGLEYMKKAGYNPVGMLTFMERLAEHPEVVDWGILQDHPQATDRAKAIKDRLVEMGVPINRRAVTTWSTATVRPEATKTGPACDVLIGESKVCKISDEQRADAAAQKINTLFDKGLLIHEIKVTGATVTVRGEPVFQATEDDAALSGKTPSQVATGVAKAIRGVLFKNIVNDIY